jgi:hypothetical protein
MDEDVNIDDFVLTFDGRILRISPAPRGILTFGAGDVNAPVSILIVATGNCLKTAVGDKRVEFSRILLLSGACSGRQPEILTHFSNRFSPWYCNF